MSLEEFNNNKVNIKDNSKELDLFASTILEQMTKLKKKLISTLLMKSYLNYINKFGRKFYIKDLKHCLNNTLNRILVIMQRIDQLFFTELH